MKAARENRAEGPSSKLLCRGLCIQAVSFLHLLPWLWLTDCTLHLFSISVLQGVSHLLELP